MPRRLHCPYCNEIVEAPHRPGAECPNAPTDGENFENATRYTGPLDDEGRPIGVAVRTSDEGRRETIRPRIGQSQPASPPPPPSQPRPPSTPSGPRTPRGPSPQSPPPPATSEEK